MQAFHLKVCVPFTNSKFQNPALMTNTSFDIASFGFLDNIECDRCGHRFLLLWFLAYGLALGFTSCAYGQLSTERLMSVYLRCFANFTATCIYVILIIIFVPIRLFVGL